MPYPNTETDNQQPLSHGGRARPVKLTWSRVDLGATSNSGWAQRPAWATKACLGIGWPATGTPIGALTIEESDSSSSTSGATIVTLATTPTGTAASTIVTFSTSAPYVRVVYTRTSGGTGAALTDSTGTAGTKPTITWSA